MQNGELLSIHDGVTYYRNGKEISRKQMSVKDTDMELYERGKFLLAELKGPENIAQEDFENNIINKFEIMSSFKAENYSAFPNSVNESNCHTTTSVLLGISEARVPMGHNPKGGLEPALKLFYY